MSDFADGELELVDQVGIARRTLIAGLGLLAGTSIVTDSPAEAAPNASPAAGAVPAGSPVATTIASPPVTGFTYKVVQMYEFLPFSPNAQKTWGGFGVYPAGTSTALRAAVDIPSGALVRDVEYYIYNDSGSAIFPDTYLYVPGQGTISSIDASVSVASTGSITATRAVVPSSNFGPYPAGAKLLVSLSPPTTGKVQINGARVGFSGGGGQLALRQQAVRVYNTQTGGGKFTTGETRAITIASGACPVGTIGLLINVTASGASTNGSLKVYLAPPAPADSSVYFTTLPAVQNMIVAIGASRVLQVFASTPVDVAIDVLGTIA